MKRSTKLTIWAAVFLIAAVFAVPQDGTEYAPFLGVLGAILLACVGIAFLMLSSAAHQKELDREARIQRQAIAYAALDAALTAQIHRADQNLKTLDDLSTAMRKPIRLDPMDEYDLG